ncbi:MAG: tetratricopeptide repeat protein [Chloroflexota bacterium]|nr:tetratricopeptide repeat protein [Chloroflexota bacterium]
MREYVETSIEQWAMPLKWGTNPHDQDLYILLADAAARQRDLAAIRKYAPLAEELAVRDDHKLYRAMAHRALAVAHRLAGEHDESGTRLNDALELLQPLGTRWQIGRTWFEWGELEDARGNRAGARDYFSRALAEYDAMRAVPDAANVRARMQSLSA